MPDEDNDLVKMLADVTELARSWKLRGFAACDMVAALAASGITAMQGARMQRDDMVEVIDRHLGLIPHARPTVKA